MAVVLELIRESCQLGNEAALNFVSLRSLVDGVGSGALSRVEMNALRAPLTALPSREDKYVLDEADDFIDSDKASIRTKALSRTEFSCAVFVTPRVARVGLRTKSSEHHAESPAVKHFAPPSIYTA